MVLKWSKSVAQLLVFLVVLLSFLLINGCHQQTATHDSTIPTKQPESAVPENFTTYTEESGLFSISYPEGWSIPSLYMMGWEENAKKLRAIITLNLPLEEDLVLFDTGFGPRLGMDPAVRVRVMPFPPTIGSLEELVEVEITRELNEHLQYDPDYCEKEFSRVSTVIDGREAIIRDYENVYNDSPTRIVQMTMVMDRVAWVATCVTKRGEEFKEILHDIVTSLRISPTLEPPAYSLYPIEFKICPQDSIVVPQGKSNKVTIEVTSLVTEQLQIDISVPPEWDLPQGVDIEFRPATFVLYFGQTVDVEANLTVSPTAPPPNWSHWTPPPDGDRKFLPAVPTEAAYHRISISTGWSFPFLENKEVKERAESHSQTDLSMKLRFEEPPPLPPGMITLKEAQDAVDFYIYPQLPLYLPEGTEHPFIGLTLTPEEPRGVIVHYSTFQIILMPEPGIEGPPRDAVGQRVTIYRFPGLIGEKRVDFWAFDLHYSVCSEKISVEEMVKIAEWMFAYQPGSGSWLR